MFGKIHTKREMDMKIQKLINGYHSSVGFMLVMGVIMGVVYFSSLEIRFDTTEQAKMPKNHSNDIETCDLFSGTWVYDNISRPLYREKECSFLAYAYACGKFGRTDFEYQFWRWQPHGCDLPRFNGTALLEQLRNKRLVFVGDSLGNNHWTSLICLIDSWIAEPSHKVVEWHGSLTSFTASEYNVSIDFYWEPMLVESNCDNPIKHRVSNRSIKIESIERHAKQWIDADILIFDSYAWWLIPNMTLLWGSTENPKRTYVESEMTRRYEMALATWSDWLNVHLNRTKTRIFFTSASPIHQNGHDWGKAMGENCFNETEPILKQGYWGQSTRTELMRSVEQVVKDLQKKSIMIEILNITQLSEYRKDAHPTIYKRHWIPPTEEELSNPVKHADCTHWCLPGVPDVWNEILYSYIRYRL